MGNLFEDFENEFRLVDLDGIVLTSPGDFILINEPEDMGIIMITLLRTKNHGLDFEFSASDTPFKFDLVEHESEKAKSESETSFSGYTFIEALYDAGGIDAKCIFEYRHIGETPELQYSGRLSMKFGINDDVNAMNSRRVNLDDLMRTRIGIKVDFDATESIDGTAVTGLSSQSMFLHSKQVLTSFFADALPLVLAGVKSEVLGVTNETFFTDVSYENITINGIKEFQNNFLVLEDKPAVTFEIPSGGLFKINEIKVRKLVTKSGGGDTDISVRYRVNDGDDILMGTESNLSGNFSDVEFKRDLTDIQIHLPVPEVTGMNKLHIFVRVVFTAASGDFSIEDGNINVVPIRIKSDLLDADLFSRQANSFADVYNTFDSFNHILEVINNGTNLFISDFWSTLGDEIYKSNGYKIRASPSKPVRASFEQMYEKWAKQVFGLGMAIVEVGGVSKVLMEKYEFFYQNKEILTIDSIEEGSWELIHDKDVFFNEVEIGYREIPKSTDENKDGNLDEFLTRHELITPIETIKNKALHISDSVTSGYLLESQRREQFRDVPQDTVSYDENLFALKGITSAVYEDLEMQFLQLSGPINTIDIEATFLNLAATDVITISDTNNNNQDFTIEEISDDLTSNANFDIGVRLTVTETITVEGPVTATLTKAASFLRAERDEAFDILDGVLDAKTIYNAGLNVKNMLMNQSPILNSGFVNKAGTAKIKTQEAFLNGLMRSQFKVGEGGYVRDPDRQTIIQNEDLTISQLNQNKKIHTGFIFKFKARLDYSTEILRIRDANLNQSSEDINYGFLRVLGDDGIFRKGHVIDMKYPPMNEFPTEFICRELFE